MQTECTQSQHVEKIILPHIGRRNVEVDFSAGQISSDGGGLLLNQVDLKLRLTEQMAHCFSPHCAFGDCPYSGGVLGY